MNSEWVTSSLLDHYEVRSGLSKPAKYFGSGYPFLTFKDVFYNYFTPERLGDFVQSTQKEREGCSVLRGDVFLTRTSETMHELGMSCVALQDYKDATFNGFCKRLRPKPDSELLPEYVGYYLRSPKFRQSMLALSTMSTRASLNNEMIGRLEISFPRRVVQKQISEILKSLDDRITLLRETNFTLEAIAQALFKAWFVDFDPVFAKMEGRIPDGMDEATAALFPDGLEDGPTGTVPRGWRQASIGEIAVVTDCLHSKKPSFLKEGKPYLQLNNICDDGLLDSSILACISQEDYSKWISRIEVACGDCVITNVGRVGAVSQIPDGFKAAMGRNMTAIRLKPDWPYPTYLIELLLSAEMKSEIEKKTDTGTILNALNVRSIPLLRCLLAPHYVMDKFESISRPFRAGMEKNLGRIQTLANLRDTLLPRLISGQLRIPEAEAQIDALAA